MKTKCNNRRPYISDSFDDHEEYSNVSNTKSILLSKLSFTYTDDHMSTLDDNDDEEFYECYDDSCENDIARIDINQKDIVTNISNTICYDNDSIQNTIILDNNMKLDNSMNDTTFILNNNIVVIDETCNVITVTHIVDNSIHDIDIIHSKIDNNDECLIISYRYDVKDIHYMYKYIQHIFTSLLCETKFNVDKTSDHLQVMNDEITNKTMNINDETITPADQTDCNL